MQKAASRLGVTVFSTIFQSRFFLLGPAAQLLQQRFGRGNGGSPRIRTELHGL